MSGGSSDAASATDGGGSGSGLDSLWEDDEIMPSAAASEAGEEAGEEAGDWYGKSVEEIYADNFQFVGVAASRSASAADPVERKVQGKT